MAVRRVEWRGKWHRYDAITLKDGCRNGVGDHCRDLFTRPCCRVLFGPFMGVAL